MGRGRMWDADAYEDPHDSSDEANSEDDDEGGD